MLIEIYCDKFKSNGKTRSPIRFENGLNIVEGADNGSNSIGKSTFLMIIDFCFGGNDYVNVLKDVEKNVGPHTIFFAFSFDKTYHFARKTDEKDFVYLSSSNYLLSDKKISIDKFCEFLREKYNIPILDLTFRSIVSRFMRIYNRQNLDEQLPLRAHENETEKNSLLEMIKLFNLYEPLKELHRISEEASEMDTTLGKAQEYKFIPKINLTEFKANEKRIHELKLEAELLADRSDRGLLDLPAEKAEQLARLKDQITALKRNRARFYNQLKAYKQDSEYEAVGLKSDFSELKEFFNNVNIENLREVEEFHRKISAILRKEIKISSQELWDNINSLNLSITELENELSEIHQTTNVSKVILKSYYTLEKEIESLQKANEFYLKKNELRKDALDKEKLLAEKTNEQFATMTAKINSKMEQINSINYVNETHSPILTTPSTKKYNFETPDDQGTGCRFKGMITLDMAILSITPLPIITHDSLMFVQMSYPRVERTFKLYSEVANKQIFVAVDRTTNLNDEAKRIIDSHRRLYLSPEGNELFGWYWGKPKGAL
ncbi:MAG: DUF2326 domain-containing protein [Flavobacteriales bacterium]|nr:DUF2326 domain-containing protein [Flavobacteriales bacterium]